MNSLHGLILPVMLLNLLLLTSVYGGCVNRTEITEVNNEKKESESSVSEFFTNLKCEVVTGAKNVKDKLEEGYDYLKKKIATQAEQNERPIEKTTEKPSLDVRMEKGGPIVFPDENRDLNQSANTYGNKKSTPLAPWPGSTTERSSKVMDVTIPTNSTTITIGDRNSLTAPSVCSGNQKPDPDGNCQEISDL